MKPDELYKAILRSITLVYTARLERADCVSIAVTPSMLDEMARNAAQVVLLLDGPEEQAGPDNSGGEW